LTQTPARKAWNFLNSLGVNTHLAYTNELYGNVGETEKALAFLGVRHVRDGVPVPGAPAFAASKDLMDKGIGLDLVVQNGSPGKPANVQADVASAKLLQPKPGQLDAIEGFNEPDFYPVTYGGQTSTISGQPGFAPVAAGQTALYTTVHNDPALAGVAVYDDSYGYKANFNGVWGQINGHADYANVHAYAQNGDQTLPWMQSAWTIYDLSAATSNRVITETGYYTVPNDTDLWGGVDEHTQATETLNLFTDAWNAGVSRTYTYELFDEGTSLEDMADHFGIIRADGSAKEAAVDIHNLTSILFDTPGSGMPGSLGYFLSGMPDTAQSALLQKDSGEFDLVVWKDPKVWDQATHSPIQAAAAQVTLTLDPGELMAGKVYDPTVGTSPIADYGAASSFSMSITDHPVILALSHA